MGSSSYRPGNNDGFPVCTRSYAVETQLTTTSMKRPPPLKTTFGSIYFVFDFAPLLRRSFDEVLERRLPKVKSKMATLPNSKVARLNRI